MKVSIPPDVWAVGPPLAPPPALPPATAGVRWPWLLATLALTATSGVLWLRTIPRVFQFLGTSDGGDYTEWVYSPLTWAYFLTAVLGAVAAIVLAVPQWRQRTRLLLFALFAVFAMTIVVRGQHESTARRHVAPKLVAAVEAFRGPDGASSSGPAVETFDGGFPPDGVLPEPWASRSWTLPTDSAAAGCAATNQLIAGGHGWKPQGAAWLCEFTHQQGRVCVRIDNYPQGGAETVEVYAFPRDGTNC